MKRFYFDAKLFAKVNVRGVGMFTNVSCLI